VLAATSSEPKDAVKIDDERERFCQLFAVASVEPA
jgi:hypothetical protein